MSVWSHIPHRTPSVAAPIRGARPDGCGLSQAELAASAGISREQLGRLETGRATPMLRTAPRRATPMLRTAPALSCDALAVHVSPKGGFLDDEDACTPPQERTP